MKKVILILGGVSIILVFVIFVLYKNNYSKNSEVIDIFKDDKEEVNLDIKEDIKEEKQSMVTVDIKGMVANPGVYEVDSTSRVNDVILLAGGLKDGADTSLINLAKIVEDEMTIIIYADYEIKDKYKEDVCLCECPLISNDACIETDDKIEEKENELVNINTSTQDELMTIDGIGEAKAKAIIDYREKHGNFSDIYEVKNVSGIGDALFEKIKAYITV